MNLALWTVQWALAGIFAIFASIRIVDALSPGRAFSRPDGAVFTRDESFGIGLVLLTCAVALVSPIIPVAGLHQRWVVPAAAVVLVLTTIVLDRRYGYGDWFGALLAIAALALAILRALPFPLYA